MYKPTVEEIKELRRLVGCGMLDGKNALEEANGNFHKAEMILLEKQKLFRLVTFRRD